MCVQNVVNSLACIRTAVTTHMRWTLQSNWHEHTIQLHLRPRTLPLLQQLWRDNTNDPEATHTQSFTVSENFRWLQLFFLPTFRLKILPVLHLSTEAAVVTWHTNPSSAAEPDQHSENTLTVHVTYCHRSSCVEHQRHTWNIHLEHRWTVSVQTFSSWQQRHVWEETGRSKWELKCKNRIWTIISYSEELCLHRRADSSGRTLNPCKVTPPQQEVGFQCRSDAGGSEISGL